MNYEIKELSEELINESFFETCSNLRNIDKSIDDTKKLFSKMKNDSNSITLVVVENNNIVIWSISLLIEQKFLMWHAKWWHLEDVVVRKGHEWKWIWKAMVDEITKIAKDKWCEVIMLSFNSKYIKFYEKCGYKINSNSMKLVIK